MNNNKNRKNNVRFRVNLGLIIVVLGLIVFVLGIEPGLFGLDRSPIVGFVQIAVFLVGLAMICLGGYISLNALWAGFEKSIPADIGLRLVSTGFVIAVASGMAYLLGFGTQLPPLIPYFGPRQAVGVVIGEVIIALGFVLLIPFPKRD